MRSLIVPLLTLSTVALAAPPADVAGCQDHPLFTRMTGMIILKCQVTPFTRVALVTAKGNKKDHFEGKVFETRYALPPGGDPPSAVAIIRNHQQAIAQIGGTTVMDDGRYTTLKIEKDGKEVWAQVDTAWGRGYVLTIVEKQGMVQEVTANAELFKAGLKSSGHVEVPGIFFDTGKAELKPESEAALNEVAKLLKADATLKVYVVGHTDSVSGLESNLKLSQARAESVVQALVTKHGVSAAVLLAKGVGPLAPVASNDAEEGRARNRRVELVKQ
ncbi:MAG: OmpA family protein [Myxococcota bacterium]